MDKLKGGIAVTLVAITCAMALAACGVSIHLGGDASGGASLAQAELKVSQCMRSHGVPSFPDPSGGGGGFNLNGTGINAQSPAFASAQRICFKLLPGGGRSAQNRTAQAMAQALQVSQCMRRHGVSGFPDPTVKPPSMSSRSEYSLVEDDNGAVLAVPSTIDPTAPVFKQAATACGFS